MSRGISSKDIPVHVLNGMKRAAKSWDRLHGSWADYAPEYWFTVHVAQELQRGLDEDRCWISLETSVKKSLQAAGPARRGRPPRALRHNGRFDILIERANEKPMAAIEIKRRAYSFSKQIQDDVERLRDTIIKPSAMSIGCLALYSSALDNRSRKGARETLASRFKTFLDRATEACDTTSLNVRHVFHIAKAEDSEECWGVQCIFISRS